jgi:hypothetical protein
MKPQNYFQTANLTEQILSDAARNLIQKIRQNEAENAVLFAKRIGFSADVWQADVLLSDERQLILNCSRQVGKSTTTAVLAAHTAIYKPESLILIVCPTERQSSELLRKIKSILAQMPGIDFSRDSILQIEMSNDSRILALPSSESNIRSYSAVDLLIVDEASRCIDEVYFAVRPMLAVSGGRIVLLSSPFGRRGFFYDVWANGEGWERFTVKATDCERITPEFLASEKASMPEFIFRQEYFCEFTDRETQVFSSDDIENALDDSLKFIEW